MSVMKSRHCLTVELWLEMWLRMQAWNKCWVASNLKSVKCCQGDLESMCYLYSALKTPTSKCLKHISFYSAIYFSIMFINFVAYNILSLFFLICYIWWSWDISSFYSSSSLQLPTNWTTGLSVKVFTFVMLM